MKVCGICREVGSTVRSEHIRKHLPLENYLGGNLASGVNGSLHLACQTLDSFPRY